VAQLFYFIINLSLNQQCQSTDPMPRQSFSLILFSSGTGLKRNKGYCSFYTGSIYMPLPKPCMLEKNRKQKTTQPES